MTPAAEIAATNPRSRRIFVLNATIGGACGETNPADLLDLDSGSGDSPVTMSK
jgi:hypothetical protein